MKKEVIIGSLVLLAIITFVVVFNKIKSSGILSRQVKLYALSNDVFHLHKGQFVYYNGMEVGRVVEIEAVPYTTKQYLISLNLHKAVSLPKHTKAEITYVSVLGGREVNLIADSTVLTTAYLNSGDTIAAYITSIPTQIQNAIAPATKFLDKLFEKYPNDSLEQMFYDLEANLHKYNAQTKALYNNLRKQVPKLNSSIKDYRKLSEDLKNKMPEYMQQLQKLNANLKATADKGLDKTMQQTTEKIQNFSNTIEAQQPKIQQINSKIDTVNQKLNTLPQNPSIKKYVYDEALATEIHNKVKEAQTTIKEIYVDPKEFIKGDKE